jgi:hypothetical protein
MLENQVSPHEDGVEISSFSADIDIVALYGQAARALEIVTIGSTPTIAVETVGSRKRATTRAFTGLTAKLFLGGERGLQVTKILASGTADVTLVRVWL